MMLSIPRTGYKKSLQGYRLCRLRTDNSPTRITTIYTLRENLQRLTKGNIENQQGRITGLIRYWLHMKLLENYIQMY